MRIVNVIENDRSLTSLDALIMTDWDMMDWKGKPDITPVDWLRVIPIGSDPDMIENNRLSPLTVEEIENDSFTDRR